MATRTKLEELNDKYGVREKEPVAPLDKPVREPAPLPAAPVQPVAPASVNNPGAVDVGRMKEVLAETAAPASRTKEPVQPVWATQSDSLDSLNQKYGVDPNHKPTVLDDIMNFSRRTGLRFDSLINMVRGAGEDYVADNLRALRFFREGQGQMLAGQQQNIAAYLDAVGSPGAEFMRANANQILKDYADESAKLTTTADTLSGKGAQHIEQAKEGQDVFSRIAIDAGVAGTQMLGDAALNAIAPGLGLTEMGIRSFGAGTDRARNAGAGVGGQLAYGASKAALSVFTEKMFDGLSGAFGKGAADDYVNALIARTAKTEVGQNILRTLANIVGEAGEEFAEGLVDPILENMIDGKKGGGVFRNYTPEAFAEMGYSTLIGGILGGLGGSVDIMKNPDLNAKIAAEQAAENPTPAQTQNVTAQALGASQATPNTTPAENAVQSDAGASNATQPTDTLAQVIMDIQRSGAEKATKAQVEAVMNDAASMQRLGVEPATAENGKTASQVRGEVRDALAQAIVESQQSAAPVNTNAEQGAGVTTSATPAAPPTASANMGFHDSTGAVGKSASAILDKLAKLTRTSIEIDPNVDDVVNGQIIGNRIILQKASDLDLIKTGKHEITHRLQDLAPEAYKTYRDYAVNALAEKGDVDALIRNYQQTYAQVGQNLTPDQAKDEIAADFTEALITEAEKGSTESFEKLAAHDAKAANGFVRAIRDFIAKVKALFSGKKAAQDEVSRATFGVELDKLEQAAKLWDDLLSKGGQAAQGLGVDANENAASEETAGKFSIKRLNGKLIPVVDTENDTSKESVAKAYLESLVNTEKAFEVVISDAQAVYIGKDLPGEYVYSDYSWTLTPDLKAVKMQAATNLDDMVLLAKNGQWKENVKGKHNKDAQNGWYRYDTEFAIPITAGGTIDHYSVYSGTLVVRNDADGKSYLYDLVDLDEKKKYPPQSLRSAHLGGPVATARGTQPTKAGPEIQADTSSDKITHPGEDVKKDSPEPVQSVSGVEYDTPAPAYDGNEMLSAQQDGVDGARDSLKNNPLAAFTAESVTPGPKNTSRLAQNAATKYTPERAKAAGMTRKQYEEMFRYRIRSEGESTSRAKGIVYDTSSGENVFLKDADPGSYDNLLTALRDAPAWNDIMVDTANLISKELETRSRNGEIPTSEYRQWLDNVREHATNTGRGTQAWAKWARLMRNVSTDGRLYMMERSLERIAKDLGRSVDMSISDELKDAYLNAANEEARDAVVEQIQKEAVAKLPASALEKWNALRYVNMLGNVKTQIRNVAGNVGMQALTKAKDKVAASIEGIASVLSGGKLERTKVLHANRALVKAATDYYNDSTNGIASAALGDSKYVEGRAKATDAFEKAVLDLRAKNTFGKANPLRYYQRATNWAMEAGDVIFNRPAFTHALAGWLQAHKVTADQFSNESWRESHADLVDRATNYAIKEAQEATFRDSNALSSWVSGIARGKNTPKAIKAAAEGVLPFRKTPANVFMRAYEYSPLGLIDTAVKAAGVKSGKATGADVVNSLSKALTGTALFGLGMWLKSLGLLRGGDDDDKDQESFDTMQGHQNYALEIPDKITVAGHEIEVPKALQNASYTLDWITPSAMPLFMGSEFYKLMKDKGLEVKDVEQALTSLADPMIQMSMLQGVENTISDLKYGENSSFLQLGVSLALSYLTQGLTNTLLGQAERTLEKTRKTTYTDQNSPLPNYIQRAIGKGSAKIPGVDYGQIDYIDEWGRTQDNPDALTNAVLQFLSPGYLSRINTTDVDKELQRLADNTDVGTGIFPDRPDKYITVNGENVYLTAQQYESYARDAGQTKLEVVRALINSNAYKTMSDEDKAYAIGRAYDYANQVAKSHTLEDYSPDKWVINTEKAANDPRVNLNPAYVMSYKALLSQYKDDGMNTSSANAAARQVLMNDRNLTARQKEALDEIVFSDGIYLPKDIEVDYTDKESFTISQLTDSAQRHWPTVKAQFNIPYQDYAKIWSIRQNDDYTADEKRQMFTGMGYDGYALYKALGAKVS